MQNKDIEELEKSIKQKIGEEKYATISDDMVNLYSKVDAEVKNREAKDKEIAELKNRNEKLIEANGNLLKQIPMSYQKEKQKEETENKGYQPIELNKVFDKNGNFLNQKK